MLAGLGGFRAGVFKLRGPPASAPAAAANSSLRGLSFGPVPNIFCVSLGSKFLSQQRSGSHVPSQQQ